VPPASVTLILQDTKSPTTTSFTSVNGATYLIAVYETGSSGSRTASVALGSGSPFSASVTEGIVTAGSNKAYIFFIQATGNGGNGPVTVTLGNNETLVFVDVLQLSSGASVISTGQQPATPTSSTTALATLSSPGTGHAEVVFVGLDGNSGADTISPPSGMAAVGTYQKGTSSNAADLGMYYASVAQASSSFTLSPSAVNWGTISIEIG
jgi:hypothetical protein